jgi:hypothetical protein
MRKQVVVLEDEADDLAMEAPVGRVGERDAVDLDRPARRLVEVADDRQQRGLARPGGPGEDDELARLELERDVLEGDDAAGVDPPDAVDDDACAAGLCLGVGYLRVVTL